MVKEIPRNDIIDKYYERVEAQSEKNGSPDVLFQLIILYIILCEKSSNELDLDLSFFKTKLPRPLAVQIQHFIHVIFLLSSTFSAL
jgi:hypothetical protein